MQQLKKYLAFLFDKWWWWLLTYIITGALIYMYSLFLNKMQTAVVVEYFIGIAAPVLLVSTLWQFYRWRIGVGALQVFVLLLTCGHFYFWLLLYGPDHFADGLIIPGGLQVEEVVPANNSPALHCAPTDTCLQLYITDTPGVYTYQFYMPQCPKGSIYLKAFEVSKNHPLSADVVWKRSAFVVTKPTGPLYINSTVPITIFEGDHGKYYAARFEVWFKPEADSAAHKIFEKNFKVQGWME